MKRKIRTLLFIAVPLIIGLAIYLFIKAPINIVQYTLTISKPIIQIDFLPAFIANFIKFHLADMLFAFSFVATLSLTMKRKLASLIVISLVAIFELLQMFGYIHGTFDVLDILLSICSVMIYIFLEVQYETKV